MATNRKSQNGRFRKAPGSTGQGNYYHVEVRDRGDFETFRTQDVGDEGHLQRVARKRSSGSWATVKWLIGKEDAHMEDGKLVGDTRDVKDLIKKLGAEPVHKRGDRFEAKPRRAAKSHRIVLCPGFLCHREDEFFSKISVNSVARQGDIEKRLR